MNEEFDQEIGNSIHVLFKKNIDFFRQVESDFYSLKSKSYLDLIQSNFTPFQDNLQKDFETFLNEVGDKTLLSRYIERKIQIPFSDNLRILK
jgi:hypothetical protein